MFRFTVPAVLGLFAVACGSGQPDNEPRQNDESSVFDPMVSTMDRAEGVEDLSQDRKRRLDDALEE